VGPAVRAVPAVAAELAGWGVLAWGAGGVAGDEEAGGTAFLRERSID
jgi:hypothetical protein